MKHIQKPITDKDGNFIGTEDSKATCEKYRDLLGGTIFLSFSRGKDSLATWLYLLECGFDNIKPFHLSCVPHLEFVDRSLAYYEKWFGGKIERFQQGENIENILKLIYQPVQDVEFLDHLDFWIYNMFDVPMIWGESMGMEEDQIWLAQGFSMYDNIFRMKYIREAKGAFEEDQFIYPIWDWKPTQVREFISQYDISLPEDYLIEKTSLTGVPLASMMANMREKYPKDYERIKLYFPLIEAAQARFYFRELKHKVEEKKERPKKKRPVLK
jgi:3'-phosphoadenosine 5'-phosphosulfate sulfotransferase (PAPS reductase)/FAD synthetase